MTDKTHEVSRSAEDAQNELLQTFYPRTRQIVENANAFGDSLRRSVSVLRNEKEWTQGHLGKQVGVSASTISRLEKGRGPRSFATEVEAGSAGFDSGPRPFRVDVGGSPLSASASKRRPERSARYGIGVRAMSN